MVRYSDSDLHSEVKALVADIGTRKAAERLGVSATMISHIVLGKSRPGPTVAAALGYEDDGLRWVKKAEALMPVEAPETNETVKE